MARELLILNKDGLPVRAFKESEFHFGTLSTEFVNAVKGFIPYHEYGVFVQSYRSTGGADSSYAMSLGKLLKKHGTVENGATPALEACYGTIPTLTELISFVPEPLRKIVKE